MHLITITHLTQPHHCLLGCTDVTHTWAHASPLLAWAVNYFSYHVTNVTMSLRCHDITPTVYRGGVLEPEGTVEIKYKQRDIVNTMARLDSVYATLLAKSRQSGLTKDERDLVDRQLKAREDLLSPMYHQVAVQFADLHDTPGRMLEKGVISVSRGW